MQYVTAKRAADMTGLSERTIRRYVDSGRLPAKRLARNRLAIAVEDLPARQMTAADDQIAQISMQIDELRAELKLAKARITLLEGAIRGRGEILAPQAVRASAEPLKASYGLPEGWVPAIQFLLDVGMSESSARRKLRLLAHHEGSWPNGVKYAFDGNQLSAAKVALGIQLGE